MVDPVRVVLASFDRQFESIDWGVCDGAFRFGSLADVLFLLDKDHHKFDLLKKLGAIKARETNPRESRPSSLEVHAVLSVNRTRVVTGLKSIDIARFYNSFFETTIAVQDLADFIGANVTLMITRRKYHAHKKYQSFIVGALTFSKPCHNIPCYLAYLAVSDGSGSSPSLLETDVHEVPQGLVSIKGYQGHGLGSLLFSLHDRILCSHAFQQVVDSPHCFMYYNAKNNGTKEGWERRGFRPIADSATKGGKNPLELYELLAKSMVNSKIFITSHEDTNECKVMHRQASTELITGAAATAATRRNLEAEDMKRQSKRAKLLPAPTADEWYDRYTSREIRKAYTARDAPSSEHYALSPAEIKAKYELIGSVLEGPAPLDFILEMASGQDESDERSNC